MATREEVLEKIESSPTAITVEDIQVLGDVTQLRFPDPQHPEIQLDIINYLFKRNHRFGYRSTGAPIDKEPSSLLNTILAQFKALPDELRIQHKNNILLDLLLTYKFKKQPTVWQVLARFAEELCSSNDVVQILQTAISTYNTRLFKTLFEEFNISPNAFYDTERRNEIVPTELVTRIGTSSDDVSRADVIRLLHYAAIFQNYPIADYLLRMGADPTLTVQTNFPPSWGLNPERSYTAFDMTQGDIDMLELLKKKHIMNSSMANARASVVRHANSPKNAVSNLLQHTKNSARTRRAHLLATVIPNNGGAGGAAAASAGGGSEGGRRRKRRRQTKKRSTKRR